MEDLNEINSSNAITNNNTLNQSINYNNQNSINTNSINNSINNINELKNSINDNNINIELLKQDSDNVFEDLFYSIRSDDTLLQTTIQKFQNLCDNIKQTFVELINNGLLFTNDDLGIFCDLFYKTNNNLLHKRIQNNNDRLLNNLQYSILEIVNDIKKSLNNPGDYNHNIYKSCQHDYVHDFGAFIKHIILEDKLTTNIDINNLNSNNTKLKESVDKLIIEMDALSTRCNTIDRTLYHTFAAYESFNYWVKKIISNDYANITAESLEKYRLEFVKKFLEFADCIERGYKNKKEEKEQNKMYKSARNITFKVENIKRMSDSGSRIIKPFLNDYKEKTITLVQLLRETADYVSDVTQQTIRSIAHRMKHMQNNNQKEIELMIQRQLGYWIKRVQPMSNFLHLPWFYREMSKVNNKISRELKADLSSSLQILAEIKTKLSNLKQINN